MSFRRQCCRWQCGCSGLRLRERHRFSTRSSVLPFICDCYLQNAWLSSCSSDGNLSYTSLSSPLISSVLRHYGVFDRTHYSADVLGCCRTWDLKLYAGLLLTFMSTYFRFAETEQYCLARAMLLGHGAISDPSQLCRVNNIRVR